MLSKRLKYLSHPGCEHEIPCLLFESRAREIQKSIKSIRPSTSGSQQARDVSRPVCGSQLPTAKNSNHKPHPFSLDSNVIQRTFRPASTEDLSSVNPSGSETNDVQLSVNFREPASHRTSRNSTTAELYSRIRQLPDLSDGCKSFLTKIVARGSGTSTSSVRSSESLASSTRSRHSRNSSPSLASFQPSGTIPTSSSPLGVLHYSTKAKDRPHPVNSHFHLFCSDCVLKLFSLSQRGKHLMPFSIFGQFKGYLVTSAWLNKDLNYVDKFGNTALHVAGILDANFSEIRHLIDWGVDLTTINSMGQSFLHVMCFSHFSLSDMDSLRKYLIRRCFDFRQLNVFGRTFFDPSKFHGQEPHHLAEWLKLLQLRDRGGHIINYQSLQKFFREAGGTNMEWDLLGWTESQLSSNHCVWNEPVFGPWPSKSSLLQNMHDDDLQVYRYFEDNGRNHYKSWSMNFSQPR